MTAGTEFLYESNIGKRKLAFLPWALEELIKRTIGKTKGKFCV